MSKDKTLEKQLEMLYDEAMSELRDIRERHKEEINLYLEELKEKKIKKLQKDLK